MKLLRYLWALPNTLLGGVLALLALALGARMRSIDGTLEVGGGGFADLIAKLPRGWRFGGITFGHVILGPTLEALAACRSHEQVHVRQYERWGPFFLPAYALSSLVQWARGRDPYLDNAFERQARALERPCDSPKDGP